MEEGELARSDQDEHDSEPEQGLDHDMLGDSAAQAGRVSRTV